MVQPVKAAVLSFDFGMSVNEEMEEFRRIRHLEVAENI